MLYKTKATKKSVILRSSSTTRSSIGNTMSLMTGYGLATIYKHGWGVDIDELIEILNQPINRKQRTDTLKWALPKNGGAVHLITQVNIRKALELIY